MKEILNKISESIISVRNYMKSCGSSNVPMYFEFDFILAIIGAQLIIFGLIGDNIIGMVIAGVCLILSPIILPVLISVSIVVAYVLSMAIASPIILITYILETVSKQKR